MLSPRRQAVIALGSMILAGAWPLPGAAQPSGNSHEIPLEVVTVDDAPGDCPTATQVTEALNARIPGLILGGDGGGGGPRPARLALIHGEPGTIRIELVDPTGEVALERSLRMVLPEGAARRGDRQASNNIGCAALADTISLIVDRYFKHVGNREEVVVLEPPPATTPPRLTATAAPPPPAPPPGGLQAVLLGIGADASAGARQPDGATQWTEYANLSLGLHWRQAVLSFAAGLGNPSRSPSLPQADGGFFRYVPAPVRVAAGVRLPLGGVVLVPQLGAGADLLFKSSQGIPGGRFDVSVDPVAEAGAECLLPLGGHAFVSAHLGGVVNLRPHDFVLTGVEQPVLGTPRVYARAGVLAGFVFGTGASGRWNH